MQTPTVVLLGGYGKTGEAIARLLLRYTDANIVIAGRNGYKIDALLHHLNRAFSGQRVSGVRANAAIPATLREAFLGADIVVNASNTAPYTDRIALACLEANADYLDLQHSADKIETLRGMIPTIEQQKRCFLTDAGFHPGTPAALVRFVAPHFDRLESVMVCGLLNPPGGFPMTGGTRELVSEMTHLQSLLYREGSWQKTRLTHREDYPRFAFSAPFGERTCYPMMLEEMRILPTRYPALREAGFALAGFNRVTDNIVIPLIMCLGSLFPKMVPTLARLLCQSTHIFARPPFGALLELEATGERHGDLESATLSVFHHDPYQMTAIATVACLMQWQNNRQRPGLHFAAHFVEPNRYLRDMERLGAHISGTHWPHK